MSSKYASLQELKSASKHCEEKITNLQTKAENAEGIDKDDTIELIDTLVQQQAIIDQYLKQAQAEESTSWVGKEAELAHMLSDIDDKYRRALSYLY